MAIPLIIGVAVGATGLYKAGKALYDNNEANEVNNMAENIVNHAKYEMEKARVECEEALNSLGQCKADALRINVNNFLETFQKIKNIDFAHDGNLGNLQLKEFNEVALREMANSVSFVVSSGLGIGSGTLGGALTAFGAYNATMMFAAASTGTAISSLSGAAATNATLAWLGGGTLASGGMGVAGGTLALGALAAGPALLVAGWYMGSKAEKRLNEAHSNKAEANKFAADVDAAIAISDGIRDVALTAANILSELRKYARRNLAKLNTLIAEHGVDYTTYDDENKMIVLKNVKIMQVIKATIDTPILNEKGDLLGDASSNLKKISLCIQNDFQGLIEN